MDPFDDPVLQPDLTTDGLAFTRSIIRKTASPAGSLHVWAYAYIGRILELEAQLAQQEKEGPAEREVVNAAMAWMLDREADSFGQLKDDTEGRLLRTCYDLRNARRSRVR